MVGTTVPSHVCWWPVRNSGGLINERDVTEICRLVVNVLPEVAPVSGTDVPIRTQYLIAAIRFAALIAMSTLSRSSVLGG